MLTQAATIIAGVRALALCSSCGTVYPRPRRAVRGDPAYWRGGEPVEPAGEEWRDLISVVVDRVWVEFDGSLTLEGPFAATSNIMAM